MISARHEICFLIKMVSYKFGNSRKNLLVSCYPRSMSDVKIYLYDCLKSWKWKKGAGMKKKHKLNYIWIADEACFLMFSFQSV